jgi:general secretion pathway protein D
VLQVYGYVAVPAGNVIKIIPNTDARQVPSIDLPENVRSNSDEMVTQIIAVKNISAAQLVPVLRPLIPQQGHLAAYANGNMRIIEHLDAGGDEPVELIPVHNAGATELSISSAWRDLPPHCRGGTCDASRTRDADSHENCAN